jgi:hypothetical protein
MTTKEPQEPIEKVKIKLETGMLALFPHLTLTPWYALGEFVDNSIQSYQDNKKRLIALHGPGYKLRIDIAFEQAADASKSRILVEDNAAGIDSKAALRAFTPGAPPEDKTGISQFGIGMKSSAMWYSNYFTISSAALDETVRRTVFFDMKMILADQLDFLDVESKSKKPDDHGTRIIMMNLHQGLPVGQTLGKIRAHLQSIYREFIRAGEVIMTVGGEVLEYKGPDFLQAPFWPTPNKPLEGDEPREWIKRVTVELSESWKANESPRKPKVPPVVTGWVGVLKKGATKSSGISLLWKNKVIVGAGNMAEGDAYRPQKIFGASTTHAFQRIFGELDLSQLPTTAFKDGFVWVEGQQEELERKLFDALETSEMPLVTMAKNYRHTERGKPISTAVKKAIKDTAIDIASDFTDLIKDGKNPLNIVPDIETEEPVGGDGAPRESESLKLPDSVGADMRFEVKDQPGDNSWLRVSHSVVDSMWTITLNRAHPFMDSFVHLPGADLNPVLRIAASLGIAEIRATNAGVEKPSFTRSAVNDLLRGEFARRKYEETGEE